MREWEGEKEGEKERKRKRKRKGKIYIYIYIYNERERERESVPTTTHSFILRTLGFRSLRLGLQTTSPGFTRFPTTLRACTFECLYVSVSEDFN